MFEWKRRDHVLQGAVQNTHRAALVNTSTMLLPQILPSFMYALQDVCELRADYFNYSAPEANSALCGSRHHRGQFLRAADRRRYASEHAERYPGISALQPGAAFPHCSRQPAPHP